VRVPCKFDFRGVPQTDESWKDFPKRYFEFHIRVNRKDDHPDAIISESEVNLLKQIAQQFTQQFQTPVPLSYNDTQENKQRYLNVRFANCSANYARNSAERIKMAIQQSPTYLTSSTCPLITCFARVV